MELVAFVGRDIENWGQITGLIKRMAWEKVVLVKQEGSDDFPEYSNVKSITISDKKPLVHLKAELMEKLKPLLADFEVALSLASGNGKEHMALVAALLSLPVGIRLVAYTKDGVEFIT